MQQEKKLFMVEIGAGVPGRNTEQHDTYFGIATSIDDINLLVQIRKWWPQAGNNLHIDGYAEINYVDEYQISVVPSHENFHPKGEDVQVFFVNLGGYKEGHVGELHKRTLQVAEDIKAIKPKAKEDSFWVEAGQIPGAEAHVDNTKPLSDFDDGIDDVHRIEDQIPGYRLILTRNPGMPDSLLEWNITGFKKDTPFEGALGENQLN